MRPHHCGLYVHFPYCKSRCAYCDFATVVVPRVPQLEYTRALIAEGHARAPEYASWELGSIYLGGGTPSLWAPSRVRAFLDAAREWFPLKAPDLEITLECNPDDVTMRRLCGYDLAGVGRLSLGVQSFDDTVLRRIGRRHSAQQAADALAAATDCGFELSVDLICGLPGQSVRAWERDLLRIAEAGPRHASIYDLTLEPGAPLVRSLRDGHMKLPSEDEAADMWEMVEPILGQAGLVKYELSSFAVPGYESRHNSGYWLGRPYLGLGPGAHSFLPPASWSIAGARARRISNEPNPERWTQQTLGAGAPAPHEGEVLRAEEHLRERLFTGLRLSRGLSLAQLGAELGVDVRTVVGDALEELSRRGLLIDDGDAITLSAQGMRFADDVFVRLV